MASFHVSPGVITTENDYSTIVPGVATSIGGIVGSFQWGPVDQIKTISDETSLKATFGPPDDTTYRSWLMARDYLSYSTHLETVRVVGEAARNAVSGGTGSGLVLSITTINGAISSATITTKGSNYRLGDMVYVLGGVILASYKVTNVDETGGVTTLEAVDAGSGYSTGAGKATKSQEAVLVKNADDFEVTSGLPEVLAKFPGALGNSLAISTVRASEFENWTYANRFVVAPSATVRSWTADGKTASFTYGTALPAGAVVTVGGVTIEEGLDPGKYTINSGNIAFITDDETFSPVSPTNVFELINADGISTEGYKVEIDSVEQPLYSGEGSVPVGMFRLSGNVLEYGVHKASLNGDSVTSAFTLSGVTGIVSDTARILVDGVEKVIKTTAPASASEVQVATSGGDTTITFHASGVPGIGKGNIQVEWGFYDDETDIKVTYGYPKAGKNVVKVFTNQTEIHAVVIDHLGKWTGEAGSLLERFEYLSLTPGEVFFDGTAKYYVDAINRRSEYVRIGQEFFAHGTKVLAGGVDDNVFGTNEGVTPGILIEGYSLFKNPEEVEIYHLIVSSDTPSVILHAIQNIAEVRRDCVAYWSPPQNTVVNNKGNEADDMIDFRNVIGSSSYYHADGNWSYVYDNYNDKFRWIPCAGASAGIYAQTHTLFDAWVPGAGLNRGRVKNAVKLAWNPDKTNRDKLYKNNINPIVTFLGEGPVLFGDKTGQTKPSAFDHMNVRFLFIVLEKSIAKAARYYLFELNDEFTRNRFKNMVAPFLRTVKGRRGIEEYQIVCDGKNNTADIISRNEFIADIYVRPVYSINGITLNFNAVNGNVTFDEIINQS